MKKYPKKSISKPQLLCPITGDTCSYPCSNLQLARMRARKSDDEMAEIFQIARSTWWRWRGGKSFPPRSACLYLSVLQGDMPWEGFEGCSVCHADQKIYLRDYRDGISFSDLRAYWWKLKVLEPLRRELNELREKYAQLISERKNLIPRPTSSPKLTVIDGGLS